MYDVHVYVHFHGLIFSGIFRDSPVIIVFSGCHINGNVGDSNIAVCKVWLGAFHNNMVFLLCHHKLCDV